MGVVVNERGLGVVFVVAVGGRVEGVGEVEGVRVEEVVDILDDRGLWWTFGGWRGKGGLDG